MMRAKYETFGNPWTLKFSACGWFARDRPLSPMPRNPRVGAPNMSATTTAHACRAA